jgi:hypothetical protein
MSKRTIFIIFKVVVDVVVVKLRKVCKYILILLLQKNLCVGRILLSPTPDRLEHPLASGIKDHHRHPNGPVFFPRSQGTYKEKSVKNGTKTCRRLE